MNDHVAQVHNAVEALITEMDSVRLQFARQIDAAAEGLERLVV